MSRGPAYPYMNLEAAVGLTRKLYEFAKRAPANLTAVLKDKWDYSPTSSTAVKTVAALRYFGLVDLLESGESESIKITDRAYRILVDSPDSVERKKAIREACLSPKAYKLCWDRWGPDMPQAMRSSLIFEHGFNETTVDGFLANYKKSVAFAGLVGSEAEVEQESDSPQGGGKAEPDRLESAATAHPMPPGRGWTEPPPVRGGGMVKGPGMRQEVFALAEGDVTIQWPERISAESLEDLKDWLAILQRKITRASAAQQTQPAAPNIHAALSAQPEPVTPPAVVHTLEAMVRNYGDGPHSWDHLDKKACADAAAAIRTAAQAAQPVAHAARAVLEKAYKLDSDAEVENLADELTALEAALDGAAPRQEGTT